MDIPTQDAIERLMRGGDFQKVLSYISGRRSDYVNSLIHTNPEHLSLLAVTQGRVQALDEVLRIPEDAMNEKAQRTN